MEGLDPKTATGVAVLTSIFFQLAVKPLLKTALPDREGGTHPAYGLVALVSLFVISCLMASLGASMQGPLTFESFWPLAVMGYVGATVLSVPLAIGGHTMGFSLRRNYGRLNFPIGIAIPLTVVSLREDFLTGISR